MLPDAFDHDFLSFENLVQKTALLAIFLLKILRGVSGKIVYRFRLRYFAIFPYHMKVSGILPLFPNRSLHKAPGTFTRLPLYRFGVKPSFLTKGLSWPTLKFIPLQNNTCSRKVAKNAKIIFWVKNLNGSFSDILLPDFPICFGGLGALARAILFTAEIAENAEKYEFAAQAS